MDHPRYVGEVLDVDAAPADDVVHDAGGVLEIGERVGARLFALDDAEHRRAWLEALIAQQRSAGLHGR